MPSLLCALSNIFSVMHIARRSMLLLPLCLFISRVAIFVKFVLLVRCMLWRWIVLTFCVKICCGHTRLFLMVVHLRPKARVLWHHLRVSEAGTLGKNPDDNPGSPGENRAPGGNLGTRDALYLLIK